MNAKRMDAQPLVRSGAEDQDEEHYDYALVFDNPFRQKSRARRFFSSHIKTGEFPMNHERAKMHFDRIFKMTEKTLEKFPILEELKAKLEILLKRKAQVQFPDFAWLVLQCIYLMMQEEMHLAIRKPYASVHQDKVYFEIKASEDTLKKEADRVSYQLQFKYVMGENEPYQEVPPYVAFQAGQHLEEHLERYIHESLFDSVARIRLIASLLDSKLERNELYSLDILLDEIYLNEDHKKDDFLNDVSQDEEMLYYWLLWYDLFWIIPGIIGFLLFIVDVSVYYGTSNHGFAWDAGVIRNVHPWHVVFAVSLSIFSSVIDSLWIRRQNMRAWLFGTTELTVIEVQRLDFAGAWEEDQVTGHARKRRQSELLTNFKRAFSFFIIFVLIAIDIAIVVLIFAYISTLKSNWQQTGVAFLNAVLVQVMSFLYRRVAQSLNGWENIEFESDYNDALCIKLYLFQFVNSYASLFYIAFVKNWAQGCTNDSCLYELNVQFFVIFGVFWGVSAGKTSFHCGFHYFRKRNRVSQTYPMKPAEFEYTSKQKRQSPLEDHMDFVILYGYVLMFSACFPFAVFLFAITGSIDSFFRLGKQGILARRSFPQYSKGIGIWNQIMLIINVIAAFTNSAIIIFTAKYFTETMNAWIVFMAASFILLVCKLFVNLFLPATPEVVKLGLQWSKRIVRNRLSSKYVEEEPQEATIASSRRVEELSESLAEELRGESYLISSDDLSEELPQISS